MSGTDSETGEFITYSSYPTFEKADFDMETGEPDTNTTKIKLRKIRFNVPKQLLAEEEEPKCCIDQNENYTLAKKEKVITLQEVSSKSEHSFT